MFSLYTKPWKYALFIIEKKEIKQNYVKFIKFKSF